MCIIINFVLILSTITIVHMYWKFFIRGIPSREILAPPLDMNNKGDGMHGLLPRRLPVGAAAQLLRRLRHRNLVQLIGWCHQGKELATAGVWTDEQWQPRHPSLQPSGSPNMVSQLQDRAGAGISALVPSPGVGAVRGAQQGREAEQHHAGRLLGRLGAREARRPRSGLPNHQPRGHHAWDTWTRSASSPAARVRSPTCVYSFGVVLEIAAVRPPAVLSAHPDPSLRPSIGRLWACCSVRWRCQRCLTRCPLPSTPDFSNPSPK